MKLFLLLFGFLFAFSSVSAEVGSLYRSSERYTMPKKKHLDTPQKRKSFRGRIQYNNRNRVLTRDRNYGKAVEDVATNAAARVPIGFTLVDVSKGEVKVLVPQNFQIGDLSLRAGSGRFFAKQGRNEIEIIATGTLCPRSGGGLGDCLTNVVQKESRKIRQADSNLLVDRQRRNNALVFSNRSNDSQRFFDERREKVEQLALSSSERKVVLAAFANPIDEKVWVIRFDGSDTPADSIALNKRVLSVVFDSIRFNRFVNLETRISGAPGRKTVAQNRNRATSTFRRGIRVSASSGELYRFSIKKLGLNMVLPKGMREVEALDDFIFQDDGVQIKLRKTDHVCDGNTSQLRQGCVADFLGKRETIGGLIEEKNVLMQLDRSTNYKSDIGKYMLSKTIEGRKMELVFMYPKTQEIYFIEFWSSDSFDWLKDTILIRKFISSIYFSIE